MIQSSATVVIPAYNEERTIGDIIEDTLAVMDTLNMPYEIIVVDDGSTDETRSVAWNHKVKVISNEANFGKGYSMRKAFQQAQGNIIITMDSDGEHLPKEIPDIINPLFNGADIAIGSRFLGNNIHATTRIHRIGNYLFNISIMLLTGKKVTDSQTGFRAMKKEVLQKLNLKSNGFEIETEITIKSLLRGYFIQEKPITIRRRNYNISRIKLLSDGAKILKTILMAPFRETE
jgi:glycosyltransferase involved in cell wall biosynthesis